MFKINALQLFCVTIQLVLSAYFHCSIRYGIPVPAWMNKWMYSITLFTFGTLFSVFLFQVF